tara:strand:- start:55 stop:156 length:102 start_codon:yes stop_codon:yes gene_type:complete
VLWSSQNKNIIANDESFIGEFIIPKSEAIYSLD